ncbi:dihydrofolate reductase family protein [Kitasatospora sp. NPDC059327]|uniref:dihydrofolate reductase family protein n=1 Tax=Kitasatospora sp. NPDC059327 TaxID=3346803 RepID=UPI0036BD1455
MAGRARRGWWGEEPPYRHDVFVHTHHLRPDLPMPGGTTFRFIDEPIETVLGRAFAAAAGRDVCLAGGGGTLRQYLRAGPVDEMHLAVVPVFAGRGDHLLDRLGGDGADGFRVAALLSSAAATHAPPVPG